MFLEMVDYTKRLGRRCIFSFFFGLGVYWLWNKRRILLLRLIILGLLICILLGYSFSFSSPFSSFVLVYSWTISKISFPNSFSFASPIPWSFSSSSSVFGLLFTIWIRVFWVIILNALIFCSLHFAYLQSLSASNNSLSFTSNTSVSSIVFFSSSCFIPLSFRNSFSSVDSNWFLVFIYSIWENSDWFRSKSLDFISVSKNSFWSIVFSFVVISLLSNSNLLVRLYILLGILIFS